MSAQRAIVARLKFSDATAAQIADNVMMHPDALRQYLRRMVRAGDIVVRGICADPANPGARVKVYGVMRAGERNRSARAKPVPRAPAPPIALAAVSQPAVMRPGASSLPPHRREQILTVLRKAPATCRDVAQATGCARSTISNWLVYLIADGTVVVTDRVPNGDGRGALIAIYGLRGKDLPYAPRGGKPRCQPAKARAGIKTPPPYRRGMVWGASVE